MRNTKNIDPSLKKKITQNDEKLRILYDKEFKSSKQKKKGLGPPKNRSEPKFENNNQNKENSFSEIIMNEDENNNNNEQTPEKEKEEEDPKISKIINIEKEDQSAFVSRMKKE